MKQLHKALLFTIVLCSFLAFAQVTFAQPAPPPPPTGKGETGNKGPGGDAPVDGGVIVVLAMIAGFGTWKLIRARQKRAEVL